MTKPCTKCGKPVSSLTKDTLCPKCKVLDQEEREKAEEKVQQESEHGNEHSTEESQERQEENVDEILAMVHTSLQCPFETESISLVFVNDAVIKCPSCGKEWHLVEMVSTHHDTITPRFDDHKVRKFGMDKTHRPNKFESPSSDERQMESMIVA